MPDLPVDWSDSELLKTAKEFLGSGDDADQPDRVRFLRGVARLVRKRDKNTADDPDRGEPAVFLLWPKQPTVLADEVPQFHPMLDNGLTEVRGHLWLVGPVVRAGRAVPLNVAGDDEIFQKVTEDLGLGEVPAVVYDPRPSPPLLRYYESGLADHDRCTVVELRYGAVTVDDVFPVIDRVHSTILATPGMQSSVGRLWEDSRRRLPKGDAERIVQVYLQTAFNVAFPAHSIRPEQSSVSGRLDLEIEYSGFSSEEFARQVIIELKVLRDVSATGNAKPRTQADEWIGDGVEQVDAYGRERGAVYVALCCFDMRKEVYGDACFDSVREKAAQLSVHLRTWHLFASARDYRKHNSRRTA